MAKKVLIKECPYKDMGWERCRDMCRYAIKASHAFRCMDLRYGKYCMRNPMAWNGMDKKEEKTEADDDGATSVG